MSLLRFCRDGGYTVEPSGWLPDDSYAYRWSDRTPRPGCSRLGCPRCGADVVAWNGFDRIPGESVEAAALYEAGREAAQRDGKVAPRTSSRLYLCRCTVHSESLYTAMADPEAHSSRALPWRCQGHPVPELPWHLDGEVIDTATLPALVRRAVHGVAPAQTPPWPADQNLPGTWLAQLYAIVPAGAPRFALAAAVNAALTEEGHCARAVALDFYISHPRAPGAETLAGLLQSQPTLFRGVFPRSDAKEDLEQRAHCVLVERLRFVGDDGSTIDPVALEVARQNLLTPGRSDMSLLFPLGRWDMPWVEAHAVEVLATHPELIGALILILKPLGAERISSALTRGMQDTRLDPERILSAVRKKLFEPERSGVLNRLEAARRPA